MSTNSSVNTGLTVRQTSPSDSQFFLPPQSVTTDMISPAIISLLTGYSAIVGPAISNLVGYTSIQAAATAVGAGGRILVMPGVYTETVTISANNFYIHGMGYGVQLNGALTVSGNQGWIDGLRVSNAITYSGNRNFFKAWQDVGFTITNSGTDNDLIVIQG